MVLGELCMNLTVVVPTRNRPDFAKQLVKDLNDWDCEVIVVDDNSQQPFIADGARVITNRHRLGGSESWNVGCRYAKHDWLLLLADDLVPSPGMARYIERLLPTLKPQDIIGFRIVGFNNLGSRTVKLPYRNTVASRILNITFGVDVGPHTGASRFTTAAMVIHSKFFALLGGFDFRTYAGNGFREESDLQWRGRKMGGNLIYIEDPFFQHLNVPGGYQKGRSENDSYYMRNQTIFAFRTSPIASPVLIVGFGAWLVARGLPVPTLVRGVAQGLSVVISHIKSQGLRNSSENKVK